MKKRILLLSATAAFAFITLQSDSSGPGANYTGSNGSTPGCRTCHGSSATAAIKLGISLDSAGVPVTQYTGGMVYTIVLTDTNTTTSNLPKFGFECSVVKGTGSSSTQAGTFSSTLPPGTAVHTSGSRIIWGHNSRLSPASGTGSTGTVYIDSVQWTAPAAGSGTITIFSVMNDVNNDGSDNTSDKWNNTSTSFTERIPSAVTTIANAATIKAFPNPVTNSLNLQFGNAEGVYSIQAFDLNGKCVTNENALVNNSSSITINTANWPQGMYNIIVSNNSSTTVLRIIKQ